MTLNKTALRSPSSGAGEQSSPRSYLISEYCSPQEPRSEQAREHRSSPRSYKIGE